MRPIFYDTETTGVRTDKDAIVEIAAFDPIRNESFVSFVNPGFPIPAEASAVHHISNAMVADAPSFKEVGEQFATFCGEDAVLIAHNNERFDKLILQAEFKRHLLEIPSTWIYFDTLLWARRYRPDLPRHTLQSLREHFGIEANDAHRALDDVIILHKVYQFLVDDLSMEEVLNLVQPTKSFKELGVMPFGKYKGTAFDAVPKDYLKWLHGSGALDKPENEELKAAFLEKGLLKTK